MAHRIAKALPILRQSLMIAVGVLSLAGLYALSNYDFLAFHCLTEAFSIIIGIAVFVVFWNAKQFFDNGFFLIVGLGCLAAGSLDVIYIFAYRGMQIFAETDGNVALQAKTAAQLFVSVSCLTSLLFLRRKVDQDTALTVYVVLAALVLGAMFIWNIFPACYRDDLQTPFARWAAAANSVIYLAAIIGLVRQRGRFNPLVFRFLMATLTLFLVQDAASAIARQLEGPPKVVAHLCQVAALWCVYKAFVEVGLRQPYEVLFRSQQQNAEALERQQHFLEAVLDNVQSAILACDARGRLTLLNRAAREMHNFPQEPLPAERWAAYCGLYNPNGGPLMTKEETPLYRALRGEHFTDVALTVVPGDGQPRECLASGRPLIGRDGRNCGAVTAIHDITEQKRAQEVLEQAHQQQLQRHRDELAHVGRLSMMGEMTASLVHELNQPLHAVKNYASGGVMRMLKTSPRDDELVAALEQIGEEANRAAEIVRRVRGFIEKRQPRLCRLAVNHLIEEVVLLNKAELEQHRVVTTVELADDLPAILGDPIQFEQVVMNLVRNAMEAVDGLPDDRRRLCIRSMMQGHSTVRVEVSDCGEGISPDDLPKIFEPFFTTKPEGMGMGLAIIRSIVKAAGGTLGVAVNSPQGSTFYFTLPASKKAISP